MFKFLKEKLSNWIKKTKTDIEEKAEKEEIKAEKILQQDNLQKKIQKTEKKIEKVKEEIQELKKEESAETEKKGFFQKIKESLSYKISEEDFEDFFGDLEISLLENNTALEAIEKIKLNIKKELIGKEIKKQELEKEIKKVLKKAIGELIIEPDNPIEVIKELKTNEKYSKPFKILFFGINGAGKTTTIAKFAYLLQKNNFSCVLAAADTFRAASIEQLQEHANNLKIKMIKQEYQSDPAAVAFDAIKYAESHKIDVVLIDTAGRMHTKDNLLSEIEKITRISQPDLKIFIAEAIAGNDAVEQAKIFNEKIKIDGSILSKTDIDEKGGTILSISYATKKPIFYLGTGQKYGDLEIFNKEKFIKNLGLD